MSLTHTEDRAPSRYARPVKVSVAVLADWKKTRQDKTRQERGTGGEDPKLWMLGGVCAYACIRRGVAAGVELYKK